MKLAGEQILVRIDSGVAAKRLLEGARAHPEHIRLQGPYHPAAAGTALPRPAAQTQRPSASQHLITEAPSGKIYFGASEKSVRH
jgi:hypothetical protein